MSNKTAEDVAREQLAKSGKNADDILAGKAESKGAAAADQAAKETKGKELEAKQAREKAEAQATQDESILSSPEDKLDDEQKKRKAELLKVKDEQEKKEGDKAKLSKTAQDKVNERIGELTTEIKKFRSEKDTDKEKISNLEKELGELKKAPVASDEDVQKKETEELKKADTARLEKYVEEDKAKPKADRREMSKDELEDFYLEDQAEAQVWVTERTIRRMRDRNKDQQVNVLKNEYKKLYDKQDASAKKTYESHPELNTSAREKALKDEGKSPDEIYKTLKSENPKWRICAEILKEDPNLLGKPDAPELVVKEMEKRLAKESPKESKKHSFSDDELAEIKEKAKQEALDDEQTRQEGADGATGLSSTRERTPSPKEPNEVEKYQLRIAAKAGISKERLAERKKERAGIPGAKVA